MPKVMLQNLIQRLSGGGSSLRAAERRFITIILVPALIFYAVIKIYPIGLAFYISLHKWSIFGGNQPFVGLENYQTLFEDALFYKVMWNTMYRTFAGTFLGAAAALIMAIILNPIKRGSTFFRLIYFLPVMTSVIATATIWRWLLQSRFGLVNQILALIYMPPVLWLQSTAWAMPSIILMGVWGGLGFTMIIFLAGLKGIPPEYYEAAAIDGASRWQMARYITMPLIKPVLSFVLITGVIGGFSGGFQAVLIMTGGGPLDSTRVLAQHIYDYAFLRLLMGSAASMSFVLFAVVLVFTLVQFRIQRVDWQL
jgi:multiple sugar transport system permease protein